MKKLLIATAALAMVAGTAQAQSSVSVYGVLDTGYNSVENTTSAGVKTTNNGVQGPTPAATGEAASSRLGFRGTEDLGGGLKANFVAESNMRSNTALSFDRLLWLGLQDAKMGELRIGLQNSAARDVFLGFDQLLAANVYGNLAHSNAGVANGTSTTSTTAGTATGSHTALNTAINYISPRVNGAQLAFGVMQTEAEVTPSAKTKTGSGSQIGLNYTAGKFAAAAAYVEATTSSNAVAATAGNCIGPNSGTTTGTIVGVAAGTDCAADATRLSGTASSAATNVKTKDTIAAASYDLGVAKVAYIYNKRDGVNSVSATTIHNIDRTSHAFSASIPVGAKTVLRAGYGFGEYQSGGASAYNGDIKGMQAAVNYNLSKRTMVYGIYGDESREISASTKAKTKEYSVGVRHSF